MAKLAGEQATSGPIIDVEKDAIKARLPTALEKDRKYSPSGVSNSRDNP